MNNWRALDQSHVSLFWPKHTNRCDMWFMSDLRAPKSQRFPKVSQAVSSHGRELREPGWFSQWEFFCQCFLLYEQQLFPFWSTEDSVLIFRGHSTSSSHSSRLQHKCNTMDWKAKEKLRHLSHTSPWVKSTPWQFGWWRLDKWAPSLVKSDLFNKLSQDLELP